MRAADAISSTLVGAGPLEGAERDPVERLERGDRAGVVLGLAFGRRLDVGAGCSGVALGRPQAMALQELQHPLPHPVGLELVGEDGRDRHRQPLRDVRDRKMRASDGVEEPLLAEGVRTEPLDVGHVRMKDDREVACRLRHERQMATKSRAFSRPGRRAKSDAEIAGMKRS